MAVPWAKSWDGRDKPGHDMGKFSSAYKQRLVGNAEAG
jgi:hypothetical protein